MRRACAAILGAFLAGCAAVAVQPLAGGPDAPRLRGALERRGRTVRLHLEGGPPAALVAWAVHAGSCIAVGVRVPTLPDAPLLRLDPSGRGEASAQLRSAPPAAAVVVARGPLPDTSALLCAPLPR